MSIDFVVWRVRRRRAGCIDDIRPHQTTKVSTAHSREISLLVVPRMQYQLSTSPIVSNTNRVYGGTQGHIGHMMDDTCCVAGSRTHCSNRTVGWSCKIQPTYRREINGLAIKLNNRNTAILDYNVAGEKPWVTYGEYVRATSSGYWVTSVLTSKSRSTRGKCKCLCGFAVLQKERE